MYNITTGINNTGLDTILVNISANVPSLVPLLLFFEFCLIAFAGTYAQKRALGNTNFLQWGTLAGLVTTFSAATLYLISGIVNLYVVIICLVITMLLGLAMFFSDKSDD